MPLRSLPLPLQLLLLLLAPAASRASEPACDVLIAGG